MPVENVGAVDYAQYQPSQYSNDAYVENYNTQPEVYDENLEQMRSANKSRLGATLLSIAVIGGGAFWGGRVLGKRSAKEAIENYEKAQKAMKAIEQIADDNQGKFFGGNRIGREFYNRLKELIKPHTNTAKVDKAKDSAKDASTELKEKANDAVK